MKKNDFSSYKLPKQQSTNFWSQGILGVKHVPLEQNNVSLLVFEMFKITYSYVLYFCNTWYLSELGNEKYGT
jgi:hypothetical protein